jgi:hypothetical protein
MKTCKECLYFEVCAFRYETLCKGTKVEDLIHDCTKFKDRSKYVEVVHGKWEWHVETYGDPMYGVDEDFGYRCSECEVWADEYGVDGDIYEEPPTHILHYCPNCGAKMDGD